jgi:hypothetical protein
MVAVTVAVVVAVVVVVWTPGLVRARKVNMVDYLHSKFLNDN